LKDDPEEDNEKRKKKDERKQARMSKILFISLGIVHPPHAMQYFYVQGSITGSPKIVLSSRRSPRGEQQRSEVSYRLPLDDSARFESV
jgi:hypothetical protein